MKFEINRMEMLEAAKNAVRVAPTGSPVDVLNGILVEANDDTAEVFLTATNYEQSIQQKVIASVEESGAMLVNPRLLAGMLSLLPGDFVEFLADSPETLKVTGGRCTYVIKCLPAKHYPKPTMPFPEETIKLTGVCSLAKRTVFAVSKDDNKPALQCVNVKFRRNGIHAAACDGTRLMMIKNEVGSQEERELLIPGRSLQMLASISSDKDVFDVGDVGNEVVFMRSNLMFTMRKLPSGEYMDVTAVLKSIKPEYAATLDAGKLKEALGIVVVGPVAEPINLLLSDGQVILRRNSDYSEATTAITANISKDTPEEGFYYEISSLVKLFQVIEGKVKLEIDAKGVMVVKTRNEVYFQLPQRGQVKKDKAAEVAKSTKSGQKAA